jgi:hypothetical protein
MSTVGKKKNIPTPLQLAFKEGEDSKSEDEKSFGSCSGVIVDSWCRTEGGSPSYV